MEAVTYFQEFFFAIDCIPLVKLSLALLTRKAVQEENKHFLKCVEMQWSKMR